MRLLNPVEIEVQLNRGKAVEAFLGNCTDDPEIIGWLELRRSGNAGYILMKFLVEDVGDPGFLDIYAFPEAEKPEEWTFKTLEEAMHFVAAEFPDTGFMNAGMMQDVYDTFLNDKNAPDV